MYLLDDSPVVTSLPATHEHKYEGELFIHPIAIPVGMYRLKLMEGWPNDIKCPVNVPYAGICKQSKLVMSSEHEVAGRWGDNIGNEELIGYEVHIHFKFPVNRIPWAYGFSGPVAYANQPVVCRSGR